MWPTTAMEQRRDSKPGRGSGVLSWPRTRTRGGRSSREGWEEWQDPQSFAQQPGSQGQHTYFYIPVTMVDHTQVNIHLGLDPDQTLHHDSSTAKTKNKQKNLLQFNFDRDLTPMLLFFWKLPLLSLSFQLSLPPTSVDKLSRASASGWKLRNMQTAADRQEDTMRVKDKAKECALLEPRFTSLIPCCWPAVTHSMALNTTSYFQGEILLLFEIPGQTEQRDNA